MRPLLLSQSDSSGGAARASFRLHQALLSCGIDSRMQVGVRNTDDITIDCPIGELRKLASKVRPRLGSLLMRLQRTPNTSLHSPNYFNSGLVKNLNQADADVLNLHWVNNEFLSIEDIGSLQKPVVLTLHDMWAFCGAEHYASDDENARWRKGYSVKNRLDGYAGIDIDRWVWRRKSKAWQRPMHIVTPSRWLADCARASTLMRDWPIHVIPNPIDTRQYQPWSKKLAREILGLPQAAKLVMFGAMGGSADPRKGWDLLQEALLTIADKVTEIECIIFGQSTPQNSPNLRLPLHWMGHVHDDATLSLLYSAADVMVVPSRQENLPQSATEAQSCGCPVVAFNCTGLPDVVEHKKTGYLAKAYDVRDLANGILWVLGNEKRYLTLSKAARQRSVALWSQEIVAKKYLEVYKITAKDYKDRY